LGGGAGVPFVLAVQSLRFFLSARRAPA